MKKALVAKLTATPGEAAAAADSVGSLSEREMRSRWGLLAALAGKRYFTRFAGEPVVVVFSWKIPGKLLVSTAYNLTKTGQIKNDVCCGPEVSEYRWDAARSVIAESLYGAVMSALADGSIESSHGGGRFRSKMSLNADGSWARRTEEMKNGVWRPAKYASSTYYEMTPQFIASLREQSDDDGIFGALAMATGAALAGGNAEQVMGMAMKGAELTTDNEMSRNVLAGQGDAMVAEGTQRMIAENARSNADGAASGPSTSRESPAELGPARNSASVTGTATTSARPRRKMYSWCWATAGGRGVYMSSVGSRDVSVDETQQWRSAMESEFKQRISGVFDTAQCDIDDDSDFSYTRNSIAADKPAQMTWAPH